jgi:hypothetical protein
VKRLLYVPLTEAAYDAIIARAGLEKRRPQEEVAVIVERALGLLDTPPPLRELRPEWQAEALEVGR